MNNNSTVIRCDDVAKSYHDGKLSVSVLQDINLSVNKGEQLAIVGASGSGKSTLLHVMGGLDSVSKGQVLVQGQNIQHLNEAQRGDLRNEALGFIYQFHHLLAEFTALENVAMPLLIRGDEPEAAAAQAEEMLVKVELGHRLLHKPAELSGGERQRTAIARAMVTKPACILADEPTGNLDRKTADHVYQQLLELNQEMGTSLIMVTHDMDLAQRMPRILHLVDGCLQEAPL
jgi:lipoprotein-releasing system ATP-binding protein